MSSNNKDQWENYQPSMLTTPGIGNNHLGVAKVMYDASVHEEVTDKNSVSHIQVNNI